MTITLVSGTIISVTLGSSLKVPCQHPISMLIDTRMVPEGDISNSNWLQDGKVAGREGKGRKLTFHHLHFVPFIYYYYF